MDEQINKGVSKKGLNPVARLFIVGLLVGIILMGTFYLGSRFSCFGGYMQGFKCVAPKVVSACALQNGQLIMISNASLNAGNLGKVGLYKELLDNGSLSTDTFTSDNGSFNRVNVSG